MTDSDWTVDRLLEVARETATAAALCFLITLDRDGAPRARLMQPFDPDPDLGVVLGTSPGTRKVAEIRRSPRVTLAYALPAQGAYVSLTGNATLDVDLEQRQIYWRDEFRTFWPDGPAGDDYVLIRFAPDRIELVNDAAGVAPAPLGLRAVVLTAGDGGWSIANP